MLEILVVLLVFVVLSLVAVAIRSSESDGEDMPAPNRTVAAESRTFVRERPVLPWVIGLSVSGALFVSLGIYPLVAAATGAVAGVGVSLLFRALTARKVSRFEFQLADAIDLMVSSLRAGSGLTDALESAAREIRNPLHGYLREMLDRIRLGERPEQVLSELDKLVSLESFRLFALTLSAHWQGGGSLATTLSNVGRSIRDRVDVKRRVRSQAVETQVSVLGVLIVTYGLALLMYNNYPDRFLTFATSELGSMFIAASILMQACGLFWISRMSRVEV